MIETPHRLQSIRNQRKLLYKSLGAAIARGIARNKEQKKGYLEQGPGAVYIARRFEKEKYYDADERKVKGFVPHTTYTARNRELTADALEAIVTGSSAENIVPLVSTLVVACGYRGEVKATVANIAKTPGSIVDMFVVERNQNENKRSKPLKIKFIGEEVVTRALTLGTEKYKLLFARDKFNPHMYLLRLIPDNNQKNVKGLENTTIQTMVYESLVLINGRRKLETELVDKAWVSGQQENTTRADALSGFLNTLQDKHIVTKYAEIAAMKKKTPEQLKRDVERSVSQSKRNFHPTYAYLRLCHPAVRYLPAATNALVQTKENIPFISTLLADLARIHWVYAGLRAMAAVLYIEKKGLAALAAETTSAKEKQKKNWTLIDEIGEQFDELVCYVQTSAACVSIDISRRTPEVMMEYVAIMSDVVSLLFTSVIGNKNATKQLVHLYTPDPYLPSSPTPPASDFGHRLALRLLANAPVKTDVDTGAFELPDKSKPISLSIKRVKPWSSFTESSEAWNAGVLFSAYRFKMLNLMEWMGTGTDNEKPVWATQYTTQAVIPSWKPEYSKNPNVDYSCLIPVRLNVQQKLKIHIHTYVDDIHGTEVRSDKRYNPAKTG